MKLMDELNQGTDLDRELEAMRRTLAEVEDRKRINHAKELLRIELDDSASTQGRPAGGVRTSDRASAPAKWFKTILVFLGWGLLAVGFWGGLAYLVFQIGKGMVE